MIWMPLWNLNFIILTLWVCFNHLSKLCIWVSNLIAVLILSICCFWVKYSCYPPNFISIQSSCLGIQLNHFIYAALLLLLNFPQLTESTHISKMEELSHPSGSRNEEHFCLAQEIFRLQVLLPSWVSKARHMMLFLATNLQSKTDPLPCLLSDRTDFLLHSSCSQPEICNKA